MAAKRRVGNEDSETRLRVLDITERLMVNEGYAAVSTRRVAAEAGIKPPLVHYYFPTTEDLLLAVYLRAMKRNAERVEKALASTTPLTELWAMSTDRTRTTLAVEFMALANHRKRIRNKIAASIERSRALQAAVAKELLRNHALSAREFPPVVVSFILAAISRALVMEAALGVSLGLDATNTFVESHLRRLEGTTKRRQKAVSRRS